MSGLFGFGGVTEKTFQKVSDNGGSDMAQGLTATICQSLPQRHAIFCDGYSRAAIKHGPGIDLPLSDFAFLVAGICDRESYAGYYLKPRGPEGTGDASPRWFNANRVPQQIDAIAQDQGLYTGDSKEDGEGNTLVKVMPPAFAGAEFPGWGYGLMQLDFVSHWQWLAENDWKNPVVNIVYGASWLAKYISQLGNIRLGVAAYNAGPGRLVNVDPTIDDPDRFTTGGDYSKDVIARASTFGFSAQV